MMSHCYGRLKDKVGRVIDRSGKAGWQSIHFRGDGDCATAAALTEGATIISTVGVTVIRFTSCHFDGGLVSIVLMFMFTIIARHARQSEQIQCK